MPFGLSKKISALRESIEDRLAGREAGKFGDVENPKWASVTLGNDRIRDSPQMRKSTLLFLPSASHGPLRFVLHQDILPKVADNSHRIVALDRNGRLEGELVFNCGRDAVSIGALNAARQKTGLGRSLVLLLARNIPQDGRKVTVLAARNAIPFYAGLGFRRLADSPKGGCLMECGAAELFRRKDELAGTGARKGKVFVR
ncbi:MAG: GNAT family N-acetyltransferase [Candidatus Micrarchaeia archaeon]|jgi:hypothetical protein